VARYALPCIAFFFQFVHALIFTTEESEGMLNFYVSWKAKVTLHCSALKPNKGRRSHVPTGIDLELKLTDWQKKPMIRKERYYNVHKCYDSMRRHLGALYC